MEYATITGLHLYPVKSCRGIALDHATLGPAGLEGDRRWMAVSATGRGLTQRQLPRLALVAPAVTPTGLSLTAPGMPPLEVDAMTDGARVEVTVFSDRCAAIDAGPGAAEWLSRLLGQAVRLVRFDPRGGRTTNPEWGGEAVPIEFPDGFPLLILSEASLDDLNRRFAPPLPMARFRPNVVVAGLAAYQEDRVRALVDGPLALRMTWPCARCKVTTVDQLTGEVTGPEPLATLRSYRWNEEVPGALFGQYAIVAGGVGTQLRLGQRLTIECA